MPNRADRREARANGQELPIITIRFYADGTLYIDKHGAITEDEVNTFIKNVADKLPEKGMPT
jgi:hypothetical protein